MNLRRRHKESAEVFTESLNDIMFFLLLFFIIISTMSNLNAIKLDLPSSKSTTQLSTSKVTLQVTANGSYFINNYPVPFDQLELALAAETKAKNTTNVILALDKTLTIQDLADVMQIGSNLKLKMVLNAKTIN